MAKKTLIVLFGEDENDTRALAHLCHALAPDEEFDTKVIKKPPILRKDAAPAKRQAMAETIASFASALERGRARVVVVAHRDCDAIEPAHITSARELEADLRRAGIKHGVSATPAWELETWWMPFPAAVRAVRSCWSPIDYSARSVGTIENAKERLTNDLRPSSTEARRRCPDYAESDGILVAEAIRKSSIKSVLRGTVPLSLSDFQERLVAAFA